MTQLDALLIAVILLAIGQLIDTSPPVPFGQKTVTFGLAVIALMILALSLV